jgi:hypothetical protein
MKPAVSLLVCLYAYTALSAGAIAQIQIGTVTGTVVDPAGAFLSLASVVMESPMTGFRERPPQMLKEPSGFTMCHSIVTLCA